MKKFLMGIMLIIWFILVGCQQQPPTDPILPKIVLIYENVTEIQQPKPLIRTDWPSPPMMALESTYMYPIPYFPYLVYNMVIVNGKEAILFPFSPIIGGSYYQDRFDDGLERAYVSYPSMFNQLWSDDQANIVNMDEYRPNFQLYPDVYSGK